MKNLFNNNKAVSQILGFILSLSVTSAVVLSAGFLTTTYVDENTKEAAKTQAENIANQVVNMIVNAYLVKQQYPNTSYNTSLDIPYKLVNHHYYSINVNSNGVRVYSNDGNIDVTRTYFDVSDIIQMDVSGNIDGSEGKLNVRCTPLKTIYKYDFGPSGSHLVKGYEEKTETDITGATFHSASRGGPELGQDFVYGAGTGNLEISGLTSGNTYSITLTVGDKNAITDPNKVVDGMKITANIISETKDTTIDCSQDFPYNVGFITDLTLPAGVSAISLYFEDVGGSKTYWTIGGLTVEEGQRKIIVDGGN